MLEDQGSITISHDYSSASIYKQTQREVFVVLLVIRNVDKLALFHTSIFVRLSFF